MDAGRQSQIRQPGQVTCSANRPLGSPSSSSLHWCRAGRALTYTMDGCSPRATTMPLGLTPAKRWMQRYPPHPIHRPTHAIGAGGGPTPASALCRVPVQAGPGPPGLRLYCLLHCVVYWRFDSPLACPALCCRCTGTSLHPSRSACRWLTCLNGPPSGHHMKTGCRGRCQMNGQGQDLRQRL